MGQNIIRTVDGKPQAGGPFRVKLKDGEYLTFLHNPKTAGSSILNWVYELFLQNEKIESFECYNAHFNLESLLNSSNWGDNLGTKFVVVRNPYLRYISFWNWERNRKGEFKEIDFDFFWNSSSLPPKIKSQSKYWKGCEIVIQYENLKSELDEKIAIPFFNEPSKLSWWNFINRSYRLDEIESIIPKKIRDEIYELDIETFETFGYNRHVG